MAAPSATTGNTTNCRRCSICRSRALFRAAAVHREHFDPAQVQVSTLLSVKTGGCPEDCAYCPQAQRYSTGVNAQKLMDTDAVLAKARQARPRIALLHGCRVAIAEGPRHPEGGGDDRRGEGAGLETCATLGMLSGEQARALKDAGLTTTTTISTPRRTTTIRSSTRASTRTAWTRWRTCAMPV